MLFLVVAAVIVLSLIAYWRSVIKRRLRDANVCYAVTDRRAIVWTPEPKRNVVEIRTIPRGDIRNLVRVQAPDGSGSLSFAIGPKASTADIDVEWRPLGFQHVPDVRRVEQIVRNNLMNSDGLA